MGGEREPERVFIHPQRERFLLPPHKGHRNATGTSVDAKDEQKLCIERVSAS